jgi:periplasmic divalent cation tolerance protein
MHTTMKLVAVYTTVATLEQARTIARALVERRLVACAQIGAIESVYRWDGEVRNEPEFRLLFKTTDTRYEAVEAAIRELHPYELPAIYAVPVEHAHEPYAAWVEECSSGE